jgi:ABC-type uncharacterized transport system substrate-binding protein
VLLNPKNANVELERHQTPEAAHLLRLQLVLPQATSEHEIDEAAASLIQQRAAALIVSGDVTFFCRRQQIAELALRHNIPTSCPYRDQTVAGCLMSYGANISETHRQAGNYVLPDCGPTMQSIATIRQLYTEPNHAPRPARLSAASLAPCRPW